jgi:hypothetical protein
VEQALKLGWSSFKLSTVVGLPGSQARDPGAVVDLVARVQELGQQALGRKPRVRVEAANFIPRPHTAYDRDPQPPVEELREGIGSLKKGLRRIGAQLSSSDAEASFIEAVLAAGDRRIGDAIEKAWRRGGAFDTWPQRFSLERWTHAFDEAGIDPDRYAHRKRDQDEPLPWGHMDTGYPGALSRSGASGTEEGNRVCREQPCPICSRLERGESADLLAGAKGPI